MTANASKEDYDNVVLVLTKFSDSIIKNGVIKGFQYSFSPRKIELTYHKTDIGIIINDDCVYSFNNGTSKKSILKRYKSEEEYFQDSCTGNFGCDLIIENLIAIVFDAYNLHLMDCLKVGEWVRCG